MKEKVQAVNAKEQTKKNQQPKSGMPNVSMMDSANSKTSSKGNWRLGNFEESPLLNQN